MENLQYDDVDVEPVHICLEIVFDSSHKCTYWIDVNH